MPRKQQTKAENAAAEDNVLGNMVHLDDSKNGDENKMESGNFYQILKQ